MLKFLKLLVSPITNLVTRKMEIGHAKHNLEMKRLTDNENAEGNIDQENAANRGWKDDYLLIVTTLPLLVIFVEPLFIAWTDYTVGAMTTAVFESFKVLETTPDYYWIALAIIYIDTFGFRRMCRAAIENWLNSKFNTK